MKSLIYLVLGGLVIWYCFAKSVTLGLLAIVIVLAIAIYSIWPSYTLGRANAEFNKGNTDGAISRYKKVMKTGRAKVNDYINYATILMRTGNCEEAMENINRVLAIKRDRITRCTAMVTRAMINYRLENLREAMEEVEELHDEGYKTSATYSLMGYFMLKLDYPIDDAVKLCEEAYDYDDDSRDIVDNMMCAYMKSGNLSKAKEISDKLTESAPQFVEAIYHAAQLYEKLGDMDKAKEFAKKLNDCKRSVMTTVTEEEEKALINRLKD